MELNQLLSAEVLVMNDEAVQFLEDHPDTLRIEDIIEDEDDSDIQFEFYRNVNLTQKIYEQADGTRIFGTFERAIA